MKLHPALIALKDRFKSELSKMSPRERLLVIAAGLALVLLGVAHTVKTVGQVFEEQNLLLAAVEKDRVAVIGNLKTYAALKARKTALEEQYKEVEIKEGVRSHLESLVKNKAAVQSGYTIRDIATTPFGGSYELAQFAVKFATTSLPGLIDFLKEVVHGERPMVLTTLELKKPRSGDRLEVSTEVSSIRRVNKDEE